jgi:hypothetical protein
MGTVLIPELSPGAASSGSGWIAAMSLSRSSTVEKLNDSVVAEKRKVVSAGERVPARPYTLKYQKKISICVGDTQSLPVNLAI